jgi:hypothetical protein
MLKKQEMENNEPIKTIEDFLAITRNDYEAWGLGNIPFLPWFRGEPKSDKPLLPKLFREKYEGTYHENRLLQVFRMKGASIEYGKTPDRDAIDQWLFLARHVGLPTRLLDWTEGSLIALYFALQEQEPVVWMLNPFKLNELQITGEEEKKSYNIYGQTWRGIEKAINIAFENIRSAWEIDTGKLDLPVAVLPTTVHPRMTAQRSCFTVHGKIKVSLSKLVESKDIVKQYIIEPTEAKRMFGHLRILGISEATLYPELDGLARDLSKLFRPDLDS